jgi:hypothetical protein
MITQRRFKIAHTHLYTLHMPLYRFIPGDTGKFSLLIWSILQLHDSWNLLFVVLMLIYIVEVLLHHFLCVSIKSISMVLLHRLFTSDNCAVCHHTSEYVEGATRRYTMVIVWELKIVIFIQTAFGVILVIILLPSAR